MSLGDRNRINRTINLMGIMEITEVSQEKLRLLDTEQLLAFYGIFGTLNSPRAEAMVKGIARELKRRKYTLGEEKLNEVDVKALLRGLGKGAKVAGKGLKTVIKKGYPIAKKMVKGTWMISKKIGGAIGELMDDPEFRKLFTKYVDNPEDPNLLKKNQSYTDGLLSDTPLSGFESMDYPSDELTKKYKKDTPGQLENFFRENFDFLTEKQIAGLVKKAEKSGMPYGILKQVYNRGMAAWKGGHRPGTTPQQWAFARVNSFITKSKGTWGGADKDLAAKVRGKSESIEDIKLKKLRIEKICSIVLGKDFNNDFIYEEIDFNQPPSIIKKAYNEFLEESKDKEAAFSGKDSDYKKLINDLKKAKIKFSDEDEMDGFRILKLKGSDFAIDKILNKYPDLQIDEAVKFWTVTITKKAGKLFKGQTVDVKARNSAEAIKKGIKQMKGDPALVPSDSVDAVLGESTAEYAKSLEKIANDRKMKNISKKDKETLIKIAQLMKTANEEK